MRKDLHEQNRLSWNAATVAHNSHKGDQAAFFRAGGDTLMPEEVELLGDLRGKRLVHLQCNAGQDTLSLAQRGADVFGVDISDEAIAFAKQLSADSGIAARFIRADIYDWLEAAARAGDSCDVAFCSYGATCWLSDLRRWARGIAGILRPGGRLVCVEFHPIAMMFNEKLERTHSYFGGDAPIQWADGVDDYVARSRDALTPSGYVEGVQDFVNPHPVHEFQWTIADILTALLDAGLRIETFREFPHASGCKLFDCAVRDAEDRWHLPEGMPAIPQMYAIAARKA